MGILSMRIDEHLEQRLAREAERERRSRSEIVRDALSAFLGERERRRFQDEIGRAARAIDPSESRAVAEEALPFDNEALRASEPQAVYSAPRKRRGRKR